MNKIFQNPNISRIENNKNQPSKGNDSFVVPKNDYAQNYTNPLTSFNKYLVNFKGLNRTISKTAYETASEMKEQVAKFPKSNGIVGNLPSEWINKIPKNNRGTTIKELYQDFKTIVKDLRENDNVKEATQNLNKALHKAGVIDKSENLTIKSLGGGRLGDGYQLRGVSGDNLMIKIFKYISGGPSCSDIHGNYPEINRAAYWQKNAGKNTQMVRFYFGDADAGYMINKFVDKTKTPVCKKYVDPQIYGLNSIDADGRDVINGRNKISGYQIDYGGLRISNSSLGRNKQAQASIKKILAAPLEKKLELIKDSDIEVKKGLAVIIKTFSAEEGAIYFRPLADNADNQVKKLLADWIFFLPAEERADCFKKFAENADNELKKRLINNIISIPQKDRVSCFDKLAKDADNEFKTKLACNIYYLPETKRAAYFKQLAKDADNAVKRVLADKLIYLPNAQRSGYFEKFAKDADAETKKALSKMIYYLPENKKGKCFKLLAENADYELQQVLSCDVRHLSETERKECGKLYPWLCVW